MFFFTILFGVTAVMLMLKVREQNKALARFQGIWPTLHYEMYRVISNETKNRFEELFSPEQLVYVIKQMIAKLHLNEHIDTEIRERRRHLIDTIDDANEHQHESLDKASDHDACCDDPEHMKMLKAELDHYGEIAAESAARLARLEDNEKLWQSIKL